MHPVRSFPSLLSARRLPMAMVVAGALLALVGCSVPRSGVARASYVTMASFDIGVVAATPPFLVCALESYKSTNPKPCDKWAYLIAGGAAAVSAIVLANQDTDQEPQATEWIVVSALPASFVAGVIHWLVVGED